MNIRTFQWPRAFAGGLIAATMFAPFHAEAVAPTEEALPPQVAQTLAEGDTDAVFVVTDKPLYHPGETVWFRGFEVSRRSLEPVAADHGMTCSLIGPSGETLQEKRVLYRDGVAANDFVLPAGLAGGVYRLRATSDQGPTHEVQLQVSTYELPQVKKELSFVRESYGAGDYVVAEVHLARATGEPLATRMSAVVTIGDRPPKTMVRYSDRDGDAKVGFRLPKDLADEEVRLTLTVKAGGAAESIERRVPISSNDVTVTLRPEGGDLVYGLPSRVYVLATDDDGRATRAKGRVVDDLGRQIATFSTVHDGMARFSMTPSPKRSYHVELTKPKAALVRSRFPEPRPEGCTLRSVDDFASKRRQVSIRVECTSPQPILATAVLRGELVGHRIESVPAKGTTIRLPIPRRAQGAMHVTLFDMDKQPLAERALYRGLGSDLDIEIRSDKKQYNPRDKVTLTIQTTNGRGEPVPADLALAVVDDTVLNFADDDAAQILARMYLQPEMPGQVIDDPNFYFSDDDEAPRALDLLMGTKGYRRFE